LIGESLRFGSFLALYIGYKKKVKELTEILLSIVFTVLGEIWSHSGIRKVGQKWLGQRIWFINEEHDLHVFMGISSIRQILEFVIPFGALGNLYTVNMLRSCIPIADIDVYNQITFFTSSRLLVDIWEVLAVYYSVEVVAILLCWVIAKWTSYIEISGLANLKSFEICLVAGFFAFSE